MIVKTNQDLENLLDELLDEKTSKWWGDFYKTRGEKIPFYTDKPDENLVEFSKLYAIKPEKSLDIGCGIGRNTKFLSDISQLAHGCDYAFDAIEEAIARHGNVSNIRFFNQSVFEHDQRHYDFIHDSGCLHHMPPHIRFRYIQLVHNMLNDDGYFSLVCFNENQAKGMTDGEVYEERTMNGGMFYSQKKLTTILEPYFDIIEFREMKELKHSDLFGMHINWAVFMKKKNLE